MLSIEYAGHIGLRSLTDGHLGRHLEYFKTLNDARVATVGIIKYNVSTTRINKEKTLNSSSRSFWLSTGLFWPPGGGGGGYDVHNYPGNKYESDRISSV